MVKSSFCGKIESSDKVREMLIASAAYSEDAGFFPVENVVVETSLKTRKRRLDHLSAEEKIRRKKLKNREAAQTSRDRKKAYVTNLEEALALLQQQNKLLNERVSLLELENGRLRNGSAAVAGVASGSAESSDPPQQGATPPSCRLPPSRRISLLLAMMTALTSSTGSPRILGSTKQQISTSLQILLTWWQRTSSLHTAPTPSPRKLKRRWWGPGGGRRAWRPPPLKYT